MLMTTPRIVVIGVGNLLMKDEGIGVHAVRALQEIDHPPTLSLIDGGTSPDLIAYIRAGDKIIIIDAAKGGGEPGAVYLYRPEDLARGKGILTSAHELGVAENLKLMTLTGTEPRETVIIGIEPKEIDWGTELSPELQKRLPAIVKAVLKEINKG
jgi:hydrogenase maturation protease